MMKFLNKLFRIAALVALPLVLHLGSPAQTAVPLSVEDLRSDVELHQTAEDLAAGRDTILEYVKKLEVAK